MRLPLFASVFVTIAAVAVTAEASPDGQAPEGGGLSPLAVHVDLARAEVLYETCPRTPCVVGPAARHVAVAIDRALLPTPGEVTVETVDVGADRHVVHVRIPVLGGGGPQAPAWEGLFAAGTEPLFAAVTGWSRGEPGERSGEALEWLDAGSAKTVVHGRIQEDLRICGDEATLLSPQGLDPSLLAWRGATLQRLSPARRQAAQHLAASPRGGAAAEPALAQLLRAEGSSTALGSPKAVTDGDPDTTWSEGRPGQGQGEFVMLRAPHEVPLTRFAIAVAPKRPAASGAAPRTFYLATDAALFEVVMPEDAWIHPGAAYDIPLPEPVTTSCVALVLGDAYADGKARPDVTVAELYAYSSFDTQGAKLDGVAMALSGGGPRAEAAAGVLKRAGDPGLKVAAEAFPGLDVAGRALAVDIAAASPSCSAAAGVLVTALGDDDANVREKARAKLEEPHCGRDAVPALIAGLAPEMTRSRAAGLLAIVAPTPALAPLAGVLGRGPASVRSAVRSAFAHAAASADASKLTELLDHGSAEARLEMLRAFEGRLADTKGSADKALDDIFASGPAFRTRYLLVPPIAELARAGDARDDERLLALLTTDPDAPVRVRAVELAGNTEKAQAALDRAAADPDPRVRAAALRTMGEVKWTAGQPAAVQALSGDAWTFVRSAAATVLAALPASASSDETLGRALRDKSAVVRVTVVSALAGHGAVAYSPAIRGRLEDKTEDAEVRVAAARAAGLLCDRTAADDLTRFAIAGASSPEADDVRLGLAATDALGRIHPPDLSKRLAPVHGKGARPDAQRAADAAVAAHAGCL